jgi:organic hydroperoxide reductase OsmC/OhrA
VKVSGEAADSDIKSVVEWAHEHCPVSDTVRRAIPMELDVG